VAIGLVIGLPVAALAAPFIGELLHGTKVSDARVYAAVAIVVLATSLIASWIPARRASSVDPLTALRGG
jgi:ABC-type antimicrobial peptide transport system permease subunit